MFWVRTPWLVQKIFPKVIWHFKNVDESTIEMPSCTILGKKIYLTFDDGPHPEITPWVLDQLEKHQVKATFFCLGEHVEKYPDIFQQIIAHGHTIGNHGYKHYNGWKISKQQYLENFEKGKQATQSNLFRPPYAKIRAMHKFKQGEIIICTVLPHDYHPKVTPETCLDNIKNNLQDGDILVLHDNEKAWKKLEYVLPKILGNSR